MNGVPAIAFIWRDSKYHFQFVEKNEVKNIGEIAIEISEISMNDIVNMAQTVKEEYFSDSETDEETITAFSKILFAQLITKYSFHVSFLIKNMFLIYFSIFQSYDDRFIKDLETMPGVEEFISSGELNKEKINKNFSIFISAVLFFVITQILPFQEFVKTISAKDEKDFHATVQLINYLSDTEPIEYRIKITENNKFNEIYSTGSILSLLAFDLCNIMKNEVIIKPCANCGKYFTPLKRSDAIYCDRPSPQNSNMTCKEYGTKKLWYDRLKDNISGKLYRNIYMAKQILAKRNPDIKVHQDDFEEYKIQAAQWKKEVKAGIKTDEEFIKWLKSVSGRRYLY